MNSSELSKYVEKAREAGMSDDAITNELLRKGWDPMKISEVLAFREEMLTTPPAPHSSAPSFVPLESSPPTTPAKIMPDFFKNKKIVIASIAIIVVLAGAGAALVSSGFSPATDLISAISAVRNIKTGDYTWSFDVRVEQRDENIRPFLSYWSSAKSSGGEIVDFIEELESAMVYLPINASFSSQFSGFFDIDADESADGNFQMNGKVVFDDFQAEADIEFVKKKDTLYSRLNKFPSIFLDLSPIKNQWVKVTKEDLEDYGSYYADLFSVEDYSEETIENMAEVSKAFVLAKEKNLIIASERQAEKLGDIKTYKYQVSINTDILPDYYTELVSLLDQEFGATAILGYDRQISDFFASSDTKTFYKAMRDNSSLEIWVDRKTGFLAQVSFELRIVPAASRAPKLADRQLKLRTTITLNNVNKPFSINTPTSTISLDDAVVKITNTPKDKYLFEKQEGRLNRALKALEAYHDFTGAYPASLEDLSITYEELEQYRDIDSGVRNSYTWRKGPLLSTIPKDVWTNQPLQYQNTGNSFELALTFKLPEYRAGYWPLASIYKQEGKYSYLVRLNGKNTIFPVTHVEIDLQDVSHKSIKYESKEVWKDRTIDSDKDGLSNSFEVYIGTNANKKDTDGDGVNDGKEVEKGNDPLGPGFWKHYNYGARGFYF